MHALEGIACERLGRRAAIDGLAKVLRRLGRPFECDDAVVDTSVDLTDMASSSSTASLWMNALASMSSERKDASEVSAWEKDTFAGDSGCADRFWPLTLPMLPWLGVGDPRAVPT